MNRPEMIAEHVYVGPRWFNGYHYELSLPQGWTSKDDNDGERNFISHWSPRGSRLVVQVTTKSEPSWTSPYVPKDESDPQVRIAYLLTELAECNRPAQNSIWLWIFRSFLRGLGRRPRVTSETLGRCRGFTFTVRTGPNAGWYGNFANDSWIVSMRLKPAPEDFDGEIAAARGVMSTLRLVKEAMSSAHADN